MPIAYFISNDYYVGDGLRVRPRIKTVLEDFWAIDSQYELLLFIAGIGAGKSFVGSLSLAYGLYQLSVMKHPVDWLNRFPGVSLSRDSEIVLLNASAAGEEQSDKIVYGDTLTRVTTSPYFKTLFAAEPEQAFRAAVPQPHPLRPRHQRLAHGPRLERVWVRHRRGGVRPGD